jgi:hypothetical protein
LMTRWEYIAIETARSIPSTSRKQPRICCM